MPAITSAFSALRFSGRLIVIQNAWPRFSRITLSVSVIVPLAFRPCAHKPLRQHSNEPQAGSALARSGWLYPDLVVMEGSAPDRRHRLGASQHVDAATAD